MRLREENIEEDLARALDWVGANGIDVANISRATPVPNDDVNPHIASCPTCNKVGELVTAHDAVMVAAAGNFGKHFIGCPALAPKVHKVASEFGPGEEAYYKGDRQKIMDDLKRGKIGTSFATANISGYLALIRSAFPAVLAGVLTAINDVSSALSRYVSFAEPFATFEAIQEVVGSGRHVAGRSGKISAGPASRTAARCSPRLAKEAHPFLRRPAASCKIRTSDRFASPTQ